MDKHQLKSLVALPLDELMARALEVFRQNGVAKMDLCAIMNAKSGACSEDCKYCAQSAHHSAVIAKYPLKSADDIVACAVAAEKNGAKRFGIVTSGNKLTLDEIDTIASAVQTISKTLKILPCGSLGELDEESFLKLRSAGLKRYHHNIETSQNFYPKIVTTHKFEDRLKTINLAKKAGLGVCSGGIIGLGESWDDRIDMAVTLKELDVDSVPINFLTPIKGTPLEGMPYVSREDALRTIAIFRIILKKTSLRIAAGRDAVLKDRQSAIGLAGADAMMIGAYLTTSGRQVKDDHELVKEIEALWKNA